MDPVAVGFCPGSAAGAPAPPFTDFIVSCAACFKAFVMPFPVKPFTAIAPIKAATKTPAAFLSFGELRTELRSEEITEWLSRGSVISVS